MILIVDRPWDLSLDEDIYNICNLYTWLMHVLRYRDNRLSDSINTLLDPICSNYNKAALPYIIFLF